VSNSRSLSFQSSCVREQLHKEPDPTKREGLEAAIETIEKVRLAIDPIKAVLEVLRVFPEAKMIVRKIDDGQ
jgi:hypothetical protein